MPIRHDRERTSHNAVRRALLKAAALQTTWWSAGWASGSPAPPAQSPLSTTADQQRQWQSLVAAARAEGKVAILTWGDVWGGAGYTGYAGAVDRFQRTFPGVTVDRLGESSPRVWLAKMQQARSAGAHTFDLALVQPTPAITEGRAKGLWAPLKPQLFHPEVTAESAWRDGTSTRFLDAQGNLCFAWECYALRACAINTDRVSHSDIKSVKDLVAPKWRGKIIMSDPRLGVGLLIAASIARQAGKDVLTQLLLGQRPVVVGEARQLAEAVVSGSHPIVLGLRPKALAPFRAQGVDRKVKFLDLPDADPISSTSLLLVDRAPHPAAARLFANWILTRDGQTALTGNLPTNSARTDVTPFNADGIAAPGKQYYEPDRESNHPHNAETERLVRSLLARDQR